MPGVDPAQRSTMIPTLNVITSETRASSGISIPSSRCGSAKASVSTARHSPLTRASRSRSPASFQAIACSSSQTFS